MTDIKTLLSALCTEAKVDKPIELVSKPIYVLIEQGGGDSIELYTTISQVSVEKFSGKNDVLKVDFDANFFSEFRRFMTWDYGKGMWVIIELRAPHFEEKINSTRVLFEF